MPDMSQIGEGEMPDRSALAEGGFGGKSQIETKTVYLPVGIAVHTDKGDKTFSILEAGDELEVLFEENEDGEEIITEIWMEGSSK